MTGHSQVDHSKEVFPFVFYINHRPWLIWKFAGRDYSEKYEDGSVISITVSSIIVQQR